jgi:hypothetical protein
MLRFLEVLLCVSYSVSAAPCVGTHKTGPDIACETTHHAVPQLESVCLCLCMGGGRGSTFVGLDREEILG